jgi:phosphocarrier protein
MTETRQMYITNQLGLHARASAKFVKCASQFQSKILVEREGVVVTADSIMGLMMLGARCGSSIIVKADGIDETPALDAIEKLLEDKFGEED